MNKLYKYALVMIGMLAMTGIASTNLPAMAAEQQLIASEKSIACKRFEKKIMAAATLAFTSTCYYHTGDYYGLCLLAPFYAPEIITSLLELYEKIARTDATNAKRLVHELGMAGLLLSGISAWLGLQTTTTITNN